MVKGDDKDEEICRRWLAAIAALAFAGGTAYAHDSQRRGGTLNFAISAETPHYDPHGSDTYATLHFAAPFYSTLLRFNLDEIPGDRRRPRRSPGRSRRT